MKWQLLICLLSTILGGLIAVCPNWCNKRGICTAPHDNGGYCVCDMGYTGDDCSQRLCPHAFEPLRLKALPERRTIRLETGNLGGYLIGKMEFSFAGSSLFLNADANELDSAACTNALRGLKSATNVTCQRETFSTESKTGSYLIAFNSFPTNPYMNNHVYHNGNPSRDSHFNCNMSKVDSEEALGAFCRISDVVVDNIPEYLECANHGTCTRLTGQCVCEDGFKGTACDDMSDNEDINSTIHTGPFFTGTVMNLHATRPASPSFHVLKASINHQPVTTLRGDKVLTHRGDLRVLGHGQGLFSVLNLNSSDDAVRDAWSEDSLEAVLNHLPSANMRSVLSLSKLATIQADSHIDDQQPTSYHIYTTTKQSKAQYLHSQTLASSLTRSPATSGNAESSSYSPSTISPTPLSSFLSVTAVKGHEDDLLVPTFTVTSTGALYTAGSITADHGQFKVTEAGFVQGRALEVREDVLVEGKVSVGQSLQVGSGVLMTATGLSIDVSASSAPASSADGLKASQANDGNLLDLRHRDARFNGTLLSLSSQCETCVSLQSVNRHGTPTFSLYNNGHLHLQALRLASGGIDIAAGGMHIQAGGLRVSGGLVLDSGALHLKQQAVSAGAFHAVVGSDSLGDEHVSEKQGADVRGGVRSTGTSGAASVNRARTRSAFSAVVTQSDYVGHVLHLSLNASSSTSKAPTFNFVQCEVDREAVFRVDAKGLVHAKRGLVIGPDVQPSHDEDGSSSAASGLTVRGATQLQGHVQLQARTVRPVLRNSAVGAKNEETRSVVHIPIDATYVTILPQSPVGNSGIEVIVSSPASLSATTSTATSQAGRLLVVTNLDSTTTSGHLVVPPNATLLFVHNGQEWRDIEALKAPHLTHLQSIRSLKAQNDLDIGSFEFGAQSLRASGLARYNVVVAGKDGVLQGVQGSGSQLQFIKGVLHTSALHVKRFTGDAVDCQGVTFQQLQLQDARIKGVQMRDVDALHFSSLKGGLAYINPEGLLQSTPSLTIDPQGHLVLSQLHAPLDAHHHTLSNAHIQQSNLSDIHTASIQRLQLPSLLQSKDRERRGAGALLCISTTSSSSSRRGSPEDSSEATEDIPAGTVTQCDANLLSFDYSNDNEPDQSRVRLPRVHLQEITGEHIHFVHTHLHLSSTATASNATALGRRDRWTTTVTGGIFQQVESVATKSLQVSELSTASPTASSAPPAESRLVYADATGRVHAQPSPQSPIRIHRLQVDQLEIAAPVWDLQQQSPSTPGPLVKGLRIDVRSLRFEHGADSSPEVVRMQSLETRNLDVRESLKAKSITLPADGAGIRTPALHVTDTASVQTLRVQQELSVPRLTLAPTAPSATSSAMDQKLLLSVDPTGLVQSLEGVTLVPKEGSDKKTFALGPEIDFEAQGSISAGSLTLHHLASPSSPTSAGTNEEVLRMVTVDAHGRLQVASDKAADSSRSAPQLATDRLQVQSSLTLQQNAHLVLHSLVAPSSASAAPATSPSPSSLALLTVDRKSGLVSAYDPDQKAADEKLLSLRVRDLEVSGDVLLSQPAAQLSAASIHVRDTLYLTRSSNEEDENAGVTKSGVLAEAARVLSLNADTGAVAALDHLYLLSSLPAASSGKTNANKNSNKNNKQKKNKSKDEGIDEEAVGEVIVDAARGVIYAHTLAVPPQDLQRAPKSPSKKDNEDEDDHTAQLRLLAPRILGGSAGQGFSVTDGQHIQTQTLEVSGYVSLHEEVFVGGALTVNGNVIGRGPYVDSSDSRLKKDIVSWPLSSSSSSSSSATEHSDGATIEGESTDKDAFAALNIALKLQAVEYDWIDTPSSTTSGSRRELGYLAQDVERHLPQLVYPIGHNAASPFPPSVPNKGGNEDQEDMLPRSSPTVPADAREEVYKGVAYARLSVVALEAVKDLYTLHSRDVAHLFALQQESAHEDRSAQTATNADLHRKEQQIAQLQQQLQQQEQAQQTLRAEHDTYKTHIEGIVEAQQGLLYNVTRDLHARATAHCDDKVHHLHEHFTAEMTQAHVLLQAQLARGLDRAQEDCRVHVQTRCNDLQEQQALQRTQHEETLAQLSEEILTLKEQTKQQTQVVQHLEEENRQLQTQMQQMVSDMAVLQRQMQLLLQLQPRQF